MNLLFLTKYDAIGASSRYRTLQFLPHIKSLGLTCDYYPLFDEKYVQTIRSKKNKRVIQLFSFFVKRAFLVLFHSAKYDLVIIEKEIFPYFPSIFERYLSIKKIPFLLDYDDAVFHNYDKNKFVKFLIGNKISYIIQQSAAVIVGNDYLFKYVRAFKASRVYYIPTVIDEKKYSVKLPQADNQFVIGWIGSSSTSSNVLMLNGVLKDFCSKFNAIVKLVGFEIHLESKLKFPHKIVPWKDESEIHEIQSFSVGIMPLEDNPFNRGKCGFKIIQYFGCGIPAIASPVGANKKIIIHGENGFLAETEVDWYKYLKFLHNNPLISIAVGNRGRAAVLKDFSLSSKKQEYYKVISAVLNENLSIENA